MNDWHAFHGFLYQSSNFSLGIHGIFCDPPRFKKNSKIAGRNYLLRGGVHVRNRRLHGQAEAEPILVEGLRAWNTAATTAPAWPP